jgi:hypoxanthine phosphoribosyltransferase
MVSLQSSATVVGCRSLALIVSFNLAEDWRLTTSDWQLIVGDFSVSCARILLHMLAVSDLKVLLTRQQIAQRVKELGAEITRDFAGQSVIFVGVLKGAAIFLSDLAREVQLDSTFDFIGVSSYGNRPTPTQELKHGWDSTGEVKLTKDVDQSMEDKNIILVEDILDTGLTLTFLKKFLLAHKPRALKIAALLDKPSRRKMPIEGDYVGFKIPDEFVVGYGLDYAERYRNLADVCIVPRV